MSDEELMELMQTLDDAWNAQDLDTFEQRHKSDVVVRWPGQPPTHGIDDHRVEAIEFLLKQMARSRNNKEFFQQMVQGT